MNETMLAVSGGSMFVGATDLVAGRPTVLFIHGLGESSLCFSEAFHHPALSAFNLVAPDLPGYGRSTRALDEAYALDVQVQRLWELAEHLHLGRFAVLGHSVGGDLGTLMLLADHKRQIAGFLNVEGNLTPCRSFHHGSSVLGLAGEPLPAMVP